jgi:asparagine synthetase B (glutamine-hydrolysing)
MCGIFGLIIKNNSSDQSSQSHIDFEKIKILLHYRGPNESGEYQDTKCHFICTNLKKF